MTINKIFSKKIYFILLALFFVNLNVFSIPFSEFDFDEVELDDDYDIEFEDFSLDITVSKILKNGLLCEADFTCGTDDQYADIFFPKFELYKDGTFKCGKSEESLSIYVINNLYFYLNQAYIEKSADSFVIKCKKAKVMIPDLFGDKSILTCSLSVDKEGNMISCSNIVAKDVKLTSIEDLGISAELTDITFDGKDTVSANGCITIAPLNVEVTAKNHEITYSNSSLKAAFGERFNFSNDFDTFSANEISIGYVGGENSVGFYKTWFNNAVLHKNGIDLNLGKIKYHKDMNQKMVLDSEWQKEEVEPLAFLCPDDKVTRYCYYEGSILYDVLSKFPKAKEYDDKQEIRICVRPDKTLYFLTDNFGIKHFRYGDICIDTADINFSQIETVEYDRNNPGFIIPKGKILFPKKSAIQEISVQNIHINPEGKVEFLDELPSSFYFCDYYFTPDNIFFDEEGILFSGTLYFKNSKVYIEELRIAYDGSVRDIKTSPEGVKDLKRNLSEDYNKFYSKLFPLEQYYELQRREEDEGR